MHAGLVHPAWWGEEKRLAFLIDVSNRMENEDRPGGDAALVEAMEHSSEELFGGDWTEYLDEELLQNLGTYR